MPQLTVKVDTVLKSRLLSSGDLADSEKLELREGKKIAVTEYSSDRNQHYRMTLASPLTAKDGKTKIQEVYVYEPHVEIEGGEKLIRLPVPYYSQRDNRSQPSRTCNTSACAMVAEFLRPGSCRGSDDWFWENCVNPEGDSTDHSAMDRALRRVKIESEFKYNLGYQDLDRQLEAGKPAVLGLLHRGATANPSGGHMVVCIGRCENGYIFNDSWGAGMDYTSGYGKGVEYPISPTLNARWLADGPRSGWGRVFN